MKKVLKQLGTAKLIVKKILNNLSEKEENEYKVWCSNNEELYSKIFSSNNYDQYKKDIEEINITEEWRKFEKRLNKKKITKVASIFPKVIRYAASILIPILVAGSVLYFGYKELFKESEQVIAETIIEPGVKRAELILSSGKKVILDENMKDSIVEADGTAIYSDSLQLKYGVDDTKQLATLYNELHVKRGWEWQLTLDDGTKVWINSMSKLRYPVQFTGNKRQVELIEGEAYFEVAHNPNKPFIVKTSTYNVEVLGTSFNMSHYNNDEFIHTTLVDGKVKISSNILIGDKNVSIELYPDQQFYFDKTTMDTSVLEVNAEVYSEWKDGYFVFEDESLDNIFKKLSRWYEIEYFFKENDLRSEVYTGRLPRVEDIQTILSMIEKVSDIKFNVDKNTVLIYRKP